MFNRDTLNESLILKLFLLNKIKKNEMIIDELEEEILNLKESWLKS